MSFLNRFKLYGNKVETFKNTRRAVLTRFGFVIESEIEVPDHPEFLKKRSDIENRSNELATKHHRETWEYVAQGFPGSKVKPTSQMVNERLKNNPDFRAGLLKLQEGHKAEYSALKGELKSAIEDNETYKHETRNQQMRSMSPEQKKGLINERSRNRYQTEEGKLDRNYRNVNHYGRQSDKIKSVQKERYQNDEEHRSRQIERVKTYQQNKPGFKQLQSAEARERTRINREGLDESCPDKCGGDIKTHRKNFRTKFWEGFNSSKESGFKIYVAGLNMENYFNGEDWEDCLTS